MCGVGDCRSVTIIRRRNMRDFRSTFLRFRETELTIAKSGARVTRQFGIGHENHRSGLLSTMVKRVSRENRIVLTQKVASGLLDASDLPLEIAFETCGRVFVPRDSYHLERPHQGLENELIQIPPTNKRKRKNTETNVDTIHLSDIRCDERLGGLLKSYRRVAA